MNAAATRSEGELATAACKGGKYLTFSLGRESYGVGILQVREIIRLPEITQVPCMPAHMRGVINLRGKVVPVADLRAKFGLSSEGMNERTCIIVVELTSRGKTLMGLMVDSVEEVSNIPSGDIEPTPDFGAFLNTNYILGMAKVKGAVKTLLDIDKVITEEAIRGLRIPSTAKAA